GANLADDIIQGQAGPDEFRTTPLWGVGQRIFFIHDGRTADLMKAIRAHSSPATPQYPPSEANGVVHKFNHLPPSDQQAILVSLSVSMQAPLGAPASQDSSPPPLIEQNGNRITIRVPRDGREQKTQMTHYRLDVPYRTQVTSRVGAGKQEISGIMGPVKAVTESGDTRVSYVSQDVAATVGSGNLDL